MKNNSIDNSKPLHIFEKPLLASEILFQHQPVNFLMETAEILNAHWNLQLFIKQQTLLRKNIITEIKKHSTTVGIEMNGLFEKGVAIMYPGKTISLIDLKRKESEIEIMVGEIPYPLIAALSDFEFRKIITQENVLQLRPSLAVCTFAITRDNFLVLTIRGEKTNVYPGRFYGQGGNPTHWSFNLLQHQLDEMEEELLIKNEEVQIETLRFCGIFEDLETFKGKPDLIGWVNVNLSSYEVKERFYTRQKNKRPPDVSDIYFLPFNKNSLEHFLKQETSPSQFCPPAHGGLRLVAEYFFG